MTVLMPVWNGERHLATALDSLKAQTLKGVEYLVVDDGSTDQTGAILKAYQEEWPELRVLNVEHGGIVPALNAGLAAARAPWIARLDSDDFCKPDWLEKLWAAAEAHPEVVMFQVNTEFLGRVVEQEPYRPKSRALLLMQFCFFCPMLHSGCMYSKAAILAAGAYREEDHYTEDYAAWGRLLQQGGHLYLPEKLATVRYHAESSTHQHRAIQDEHTVRLGVEHARRFFSLDEATALRMREIFFDRKASWRDWLWLSSRFIPRLPFPSPEAYAWLAWQTIKAARRSF